jgi:putative (di)nucleoside polyphosphate hydrolase
MNKAHGKLNQDQISGYFRANVGILIINDQGLLLAAERKEKPGSWQLPQGGIDQGEDEEDAALREMREELGFDEMDTKNLLRSLGESGWFSYQLPKSNWSEKHGRGQTQKFFAYQFIGQDSQLDEKFADSEEFRDWKWMSITDLIAVAWDIRKPVYEAVGSAFASFLS